MPRRFPTAADFHPPYFVGCGRYWDSANPSGHSGQESSQRERSEIGRGRAADGEVRERFADRRRMLEAVTRARRNDDYSLRFRMRIDDEPEIGRDRIET